MSTECRDDYWMGGSGTVEILDILFCHPYFVSFISVQRIRHGTVAMVIEKEDRRREAPGCF